MRIVIALLALLSFTASAQQVYKCVGADGVPSFQSDPCRADQVPKGSYSAVIHAPTPAELERRKRQEAANSAYLKSLARPKRQARGSSAVLASPSGLGKRCSAARAARDRAYKVTSNMTLNEMDRWTNYVNNACGY